MAKTGWCKCLLGDVLIHIANGCSAKQFDQKFGFPISRIETIWNETIDLNRVKYIKENDEQLVGRYSLKYNDILFSHINSDNHLGKTAIFKKQIDILIHGINLLLLRPSSLIDGDFLLYQFKILKYRGKFLEVAQRAVNQSSINQRKLKSFQVELPPLPEQRAIVAKIEQLFSELDNAIDNFKKAQEQLKVYRQAVLKKAFEGELTREWRKKQTDLPSADELLEQIKEEREAYYQKQLDQWQKAIEKWEADKRDLKEKGKKPTKPKKAKELPALTEEELAELPGLPEGWKWVPLELISVEIVDCPHSTPKWSESGKICLRTTNFKENYLDLTNVKYVSETIFNERNYRLIPKKNDILYSREGGILGIACQILRDIDVCLGQRMMLIRTVTNYNNKLLTYYLNSPEILQVVNTLITGCAAPHINVGDVKGYNIPIFGLHEQTALLIEIESRLSVCDKVEESLKENLLKSEALRQSILKKAFEGKLLTEQELEACRKEPDWEPAEKLLERIKAEKV